MNLLTDQMLEKYYQADLVAFVSLAEGFGLPIIEANAVGRPVLTSNISPMSEVAADAACLVSPRDVVDIHNGIRKIIADAEYRDKLVSNGRRNAARFRSDVVANEYLDIYRRITDNSF
jgi:glycosyltransferase involved in cell wall biosynthesis